jgi:hypothetical protein
MNSYVVDSLIREQIAEARRHAAGRALLYSVRRPWFAGAMRRVISGLAWRRPQLTPRRPLVQGLRASAIGEE